MDPEFDDVSVFQEFLHCSGGVTGERDDLCGTKFCQLVSGMLTSEQPTGNGLLGTGAYAGGG